MSQQSHTFPAIGTPFEGGFYGGKILIGDDVYALIVAPKSEGEADLPWQDDEISDDFTKTAARDPRDGFANTQALAAPQFAAARFCANLSIGGFQDWYLPSRQELNELALNLFPRAGIAPQQTDADLFKDGGEQAFGVGWYWTSTEFSSGFAWRQGFTSGYQYNDGKEASLRVRAVRKILISSI